MLIIEFQLHEMFSTFVDVFMYEPAKFISDGIVNSSTVIIYIHKEKPKKLLTCLEAFACEADDILIVSHT
jgi:hypothetical protein